MVISLESPLDGREIGQFDTVELDQVDAVMAIAREGFSRWSQTTIEYRGQIVRTAAGLLQERAENLAGVVRKETGKPLRASQGELEGAIEMAHLMSSYGRMPSGFLLPSSIPGRQVRVQRMPRGVALLIVTYNAPYPNYAWKVFPALMAGNSAILKPSPYTAGSAQLFGEVLWEAGVPEEVLQVVNADPAVTEALIQAGPELVSFTGSLQTGRRVAALASQTLAKLVLELGGSNPVIVLDDADLENASRVVLDSAFSNAGQRCSSGSRVIIQDSIYEDFRTSLFSQAKGITYGTDSLVDVSTLIDSASAKRFESYLASAEEQGAVVSRVGQLAGNPEYQDCLVQPALIEGIGEGSPAATHEFFGPAARLFRAEDESSAVRLANSSDFGLTSAVWTKDLARAERVASQIQAGVININGPTHGAEINMPFGGMKNSGNGSRDAGFNAIDQYSDVQVISNFFGVNQ